VQRVLEFFFDYGSPFSYLADTQVADVVKRADAALVHRPMSLGAVLKATGNRSPLEVPAKGAYMALELVSSDRRAGLRRRGVGAKIADVHPPPLKRG
jgi:2-hydroxychromene-2-carboxylate isomerase